MRRNFLLFIFILIHGAVGAQNAELKTSAEASFKAGDYYEAIPLLQKVVKRAPKDFESWNMLAESLYHSRNHKKAANAYEHLVQLIGNDKELRNEHYLSYLYYGNSLMAVQDYDGAKEIYLMFLRLKPQAQNYRDLKRIANAKIRSCSEAQKIMQDGYVGEFIIEKLPETVNGSYSDFGPVWKDQSTLLFTSLRSDSLITVEDHEDFPAVNQIYMTRKSSEEWDTPELVDEYNNDLFHSANGTFSKDGKSFAFSVCQENDQHEVRCDVYVSYKKHNTWTKPEKLKNGINKGSYTSTQPAFGYYSRRGFTTEILYFASDRPGGKGGMDIWYSARSKRGDWAAPVNCGSAVNSSGNEITPFYDSDTKTLYFSSDYHFGLGGYDVFKAFGGLKSFRRPENLGAAVNTGFDDTYFSWRISESNGTLVSNRSEEGAVFGENCCDDIFYFTKQMVMEIPAIVINADSVPLAEATVALHVQGTEASDTASVMLQTEKKGTFTIRHLQDQNIEVAASKMGYENTFMDISRDSYPDTVILVMNKKVEQKEIETITEVKPLALTDKSLNVKELKKGTVLVMEHIYFEFGASDIQQEALKDLNILEKFLSANPTIKIEIAGHTDSKGDEKLNQELSQERADAIRRYLIEKGIDADRLKAVGYGEEKPIAPNENPDGSDNEAGRKLNRRTEVVILEN